MTLDTSITFQEDYGMFQLETKLSGTDKSLKSYVTKEIVEDFREIYGGDVLAILQDALENEAMIENMRSKTYSFDANDGSTVTCNPIRHDDNVSLACKKDLPND